VFDGIARLSFSLYPVAEDGTLPELFELPLYVIA
jgi:hypothetical protein